MNTVSKLIQFWTYL